MSHPKPQPMDGNPEPRPMTHAEPRPMTHAEPRPIPESRPMVGPLPAGATHAIRLRYAGGWDAYGVYASRDEAMAEYRRLVADGTPSDNIIVCRI